MLPKTRVDRESREVISQSLRWNSGDKVDGNLVKN